MDVTVTLDQLLTLQAVDRGIKALDNELDLLPKNLATAEEEQKGVEAQVAEAKARAEALLTKRRGLESEILGITQQINKYETDKTKVKTNDEYHAINHQIEHQKQRRSGLEDQVLASFDEEESASQRVKQIQVKLAEIQKATEARRADMKTRSEEDRTRLQELKQQRETLVPQVDPKRLTTYENLLAKKNVAVVSITRGSCGGCFSALPPQVVNEVKKRNAFLFCEFCGRFLIHDPAADAV